MLSLKTKCYCPHCYEKLSKYDRENTWLTKRGESEGVLKTKEDEGLCWYYSCKKCHRPWPVKRGKAIDPKHPLFERIEG